jgi:hypothetical protein
MVVSVPGGAVLIVALAALAVGGVRERRAAGGILVGDAGSILVRFYLSDPWTIPSTVAHSAGVLLDYAGMSWRWSHRWLIVPTALQCLSLPLFSGRLIHTAISHEVNSIVHEVVVGLLLLTLGFSAVQEARVRHRGFVRRGLDRPQGSISWPVTGVQARQYQD